MRKLLSKIFTRCVGIVDFYWLTRHLDTVILHDVKSFDFFKRYLNMKNFFFYAYYYRFTYQNSRAVL